MHNAFTQVAHRPWPVPQKAWTWRQSWHDLLFMHWPIAAEIIRPLVPAALEIQEFNNTSWISLVPFRMTGVMRRPLPNLPWFSAFPELNVRVYVEYRGIPGVWFLSLDATNPLAVWAARRFFHLPYHRAQIALQHLNDTIHFTSSRPDAALQVAYRPTSEIFHAQPGTLQHWLTERYCLYAQSPDGTIWRNEVHHTPWPLQNAEAVIKTNSMFAFHQLPVSGPPAMVDYSPGVDVVVWPAERVAS